MKNKSFTLAEMIIILAVAGLVLVAVPNLFQRQKAIEKREPQVDYDCFISGNGIKECYIFVDGEFDTTCEYSELSAIIREKKKRR